MKRSPIRRTTELGRGPGPKRKAMKPKRRTAAEAREKFAREYGSEARREFVSRLPCCICGEGPSENHHTHNGGKGRKGPYTSIVPLCGSCHRRYHTIGKLSLLQATRREQRGVSPLLVWDAGYRFGANRRPMGGWIECETWDEAAKVVNDICEAGGLP